MTTRLLDHAQRRDWLRLIRSENVGPTTFRQLISRYGTATQALEALPLLARAGGLARSLAICSIAAAERDLERADEIGAVFVAPGETGYPPLLRHIDAPPPLLCVKGRHDVAERDAVAIVGARNASAIGRKFARQLAAEIAAQGFVIVSGLARGIDTAAHEAALDRGTIAVLAGGIDVIYPPENHALQEEIGRVGLLASEMMPGAVPRGEHFPRRNRIISGASRAVIVVEAAMRSGSLITARLANEQGREVFAVPGSPLDPRAEGSNRLIREGATLLTGARDVIDALGASPAHYRSDHFLELPDDSPFDGEAADAERTRVNGLLSPSPVGIDDLVRESGMSVPAVIAILLELELAGKVQRHGRQMVSLA